MQSAKVGAGHSIRSGALVDFLKWKGYVVNHFINFDINETLDSLPQVRVIDAPIDLQYLLTRSQEQGVRTLALDYEGSQAPDVVVSVFEHRRPLPPGKRHSGFRFVMLRQDIRKADPVDGDYVAVVMGGADVLGVGFDLAQKVAESGVETIHVGGPLAGPARTSPIFRTLSNPPDFAGVLAGARWVVSNGGGTMFESMSLGKATFVFPQTSREKRVAETLYNRGALLGVGRLPPLLPLPDEMSRVGTEARSVIDGRGIERVGKIIEELLDD